MKRIETKSFKKLSSDLNTHPPVPGDVDSGAKKTKDKKKKKLYQKNREVEDISVDELS